MRYGYGTLSLAIAVATLVLAAPAQAHELTEKKAKAVLKPIAQEMIATVGPAVAKKLPGTSVTSSTVRACRIKTSHRAQCVITFAVQGASTGETECGIDALVRFKNARSRQLSISIGSSLFCFFPVPLV
jgi:hypothetical protein